MYVETDTFNNNAEAATLDKEIVDQIEIDARFQEIVEQIDSVPTVEEKEEIALETKRKPRGTMDAGSEGFY